MATFVGDYSCKIDNKGRIVFPAPFKRQMPNGASDRFVVRKDIFEECLVLYDIESWNSQLALIRERLNPYNREHGAFLRMFFKGTAEVSLDSSNRLLIPKRLLDTIFVQKEVVLAGQDGRIEIWAANRYENIEIDSEKFACLAEKLMGGVAASKQ